MEGIKLVLVNSLWPMFDLVGKQKRRSISPQIKPPEQRLL
mgnify:CR=1 FL=1